MRRVITYGTFDLLHYGHINLLRRARQLGDYLIVGLSTDEFNWNEKQKKCYFSYEKRKQLLEAIRYVDLVIPEENWEQKRSDVKEYHVDTFVMGDDWEGKFDFLKEEGCEVVYLPRTPEISSSQIKEDLHTIDIGGRSVVKEDNCSGMNARQQFLKSLFSGRLLILNPVDIGKTPEKGGISQFFCHREIFCAVDTAWRTVKFCHSLPGQRGI